jgi:hypothetical protein
MKNKILVALLITQAVSLTHIYHLEAGNKNKMPSLLYQEKSIQNNIAPVLNNAPAAELLPDIQSFEDELNGAPRAELFPEVAETKVKKKR